MTDEELVSSRQDAQRTQEANRAKRISVEDAHTLPALRG